VGAKSTKEAAPGRINAPLTFGKETRTTETSSGMLRSEKSVILIKKEGEEKSHLVLLFPLYWYI
jgi:hypothetical protein